MADQATPTPDSSPAAPVPAPVSPTAGLSADQVIALIDQHGRKVAQSEIDRHLTPVLAQQKAIQGKVKEFDGTVKVLKDMGLLKDDADLSKARTAVMVDALGGSEAPVPEAQPAPDAEDVDPATAEGYLLAESYGLTTGDPELAMIVSGQGYAPWLSSIKAAGEAKKTRIGGRPPAATPVIPLAVDTSAGGPTTPNPIANINDPAALLETGLYGKRK